MKTIIPVSPEGQITLPLAARAELGQPRALELELINGEVTLRPVDTLTPEEEVHVRRADADFAAGRYRQMSEEDLLRLIGQP